MIASGGIPTRRRANRLRRTSTAPREARSSRAVAETAQFTKAGKCHATFEQAIGLLHPTGSSPAGRAPLPFNDQHFCRRSSALLSVESEHAPTQRACEIAASDPAGAEVDDGCRSPPGKDELGN